MSLPSCSATRKFRQSSQVGSRPAARTMRRMAAASSAPAGRIAIESGMSG
jgi:hypothetical protein